jgi:hypothetical protein
MRFKTPHFGPHAGSLTRDGEPVPDVVSSDVRAPVALPESSGGGVSSALRGRDGAARAHYEEMQRAGAPVTYTEAQDRAASALTRVRNEKTR